MKYSCYYCYYYYYMNCKTNNIDAEECGRAELWLSPLF